MNGKRGQVSAHSSTQRALLYLGDVRYRDEARKLFASFLKVHPAFKADSINDSLIQYVGMDIERAVAHAQQKIACLY